MPARVPLDVDMEDKLLYGLTPVRLGYVVVSLLGGFSLWSSPWSADAVRAVASFAVVGLGVAIAWGRWRARAADQWLADIAIYVLRRYRVVYSSRVSQWFVRPRLRSSN